MNPMSTNPDQKKIDSAYRSLVIIWFAILMSIALFFIVTRMAVPSRTQPAGFEETNKILIRVCMALGVLTFGLSFIFKKKFLKQSVEKHDIRFVSTGTIVAVALCEATCLFGQLLYFVTHDPYAYLLFALAVLGLLLHFPRKAYLLNAAFERQRFGM